MKTIAVTIDKDAKEIKILEEYDIHKAHAYLDLAKSINEILSPKETLSFKVTFLNKTFENLLVMATALLTDRSKEAEKMENPEPDTTHYKELGIKTIDYENQLVVLEECPLAAAIKLLGHIPTLFGFKVQIGEVTYSNLSAIAKTQFADEKNFPKNIMLSITNELLKDSAEMKREEEMAKSGDDDDVKH